MIVKVKCEFPEEAPLMLATKNLQDSSGNWENKLISISSLSRNIGEDKSYEISGISIELNDTDRFFRTMMSGTKRFIAGKKVELLREDDQLIYTGTVEKWQFTDNAFVLTINDKLSGLDKLVPEVIIIDEYPNIVEGAAGNSIPIIYGTLTSDTGVVKCWQVDTIEENSITKGIYLLAGHPCHSLGGTTVYKDDGTELASDAALYNTSATREYIKCSAVEEYIYVNVNGKMDDNFNLIQDPIDAIIDIISNTSMNYDNAAMMEAQTTMQARNYEIAMAIDNKQSLKQILVDFCFSFDCDFYIGKSNEIVITLLNWASLQVGKRFIPSQIASFQINELPEEIRNKVQYNYKYNFATEIYRKTPFYSKQSSVNDWGEFYFSNEPLELNHVADDITAFDVVQRYVIQRKNPRRIANVDIPLSEFVGLDISDVIEMEHPNAIDINKRKYQVRRVNLDFSADMVQVEAVDITILTGGVFVLGDRLWTIPEPGETEPKLKPTWSDTDEFSRNYGYLADRNTGYFSNGLDYGKSLY
jgi:hypothetical protein